MKAEIVLILFRELNEEEKKRFVRLLEQEKVPYTREKKREKGSRVWQETEIVELLFVQKK